jgi:molybdopterin-guanine dinucleotide biosynthesis protein B
LRFPHDAWVVAVAADGPLPQSVPDAVALLDLNDAQGLAEWLLAHAHRFEYPGAPARTE